MQTEVWRRICAVLFVIALVGVIVASLLPPSALPDFTHFWWDKAEHALAYAFVTTWGLLSRRWRGGSLMAVLILIGIGVEFAQSITPQRQADPLDAVANALGVILAWGGVRLIARSSSQPHTQG